MTYSSVITPFPIVKKGSGKNRNFYFLAIRTADQGIMIGNRKSFLCKVKKNN